MDNFDLDIDRALKASESEANLRRSLYKELREYVRSEGLTGGEEEAKTHGFDCDCGDYQKFMSGWNKLTEKLTIHLLEKENSNKT